MIENLLNFILENSVGVIALLVVWLIPSPVQGRLKKILEFAKKLIEKILEKK